MAALLTLFKLKLSSVDSKQGAAIKSAEVFNLYRLSKAWEPNLAAALASQPEATA